MEERREYKRLKRQFIVSFRPYGKKTAFDVSQLKDISAGGVRFMTAKPFKKDTTLIMEIRTPISVVKLKVSGKVIASKEVVKGLIYDTRVRFVNLDDDTAEIIKQTVDYFSKKL
ncbi:PilZ domain-containing protein [Candidatus Omnitrophota bacterium]